VVVFGVYTTDTPKDAVEKFRPLLDALEADLVMRNGHQVVLKTNVYGNYDDGLDAIVNGEVDIMRLGPASFILAQKRSNGVSLIAMETYKDSKTFHGIICIHEDSDIDSLEDLSGRSFAFGDENSTIGRYLSQQLLMEHGIFASQLASYEYLGKHDKVGYMVGAGEFDAGALKESTFKKLKEKGEPIKELARFPNVTKPWVARSGLDDSIILAIRESLLAQETPEVLAAVGKSGFVVATPQDYEPIENSIVKNVGFVDSDSAFVATEPASSEG
jgi:phosphonate transport system substrate-binding protein